MIINGNTTIAGIVTITDDLTISSGTQSWAGAAIAISGDFAASNCTFVAASTWTLNISGDATAAATVSTAYSDASLGSEVVAIGATDNGHNLNWLFTTAVVSLHATLIGKPRASATLIHQPRASATLIGKPRASATLIHQPRASATLIAKARATAIHI